MTIRSLNSFDRFDLWKYRDDANCWDFVRAFLSERAGLNPELIPKFGICPDDKKSMTSAAIQVGKQFVDCEPIQNAVACHYRGRVIIHVGIVDGGMVRHTGRQFGTRRESIEKFESYAPTTIYKIHRLLLCHP